MTPGRFLIVAGAILIAAGLWVSFAGALPFRLGRLPGDFLVRGKRTTFYFPLATCLLLSLALSAALWVLRNLRR